jgi:vitamin K-dependent gamma-carboxylase
VFSSLTLNRQYLSQPVDNTPLVLFRVVFGFLVFMEGASFFLLGQISEIYTEAVVVFTYQGLGWMQPLPGIGMYLVFAFVCVLGIMIMLGWRYRFSAWAFALTWTYIYFSHKAHYNNHHYLFMLMAYAMALMPAADDLSLDVHFDPDRRSTSCPRWCISFFVLQLLIVYTFASIAKVYPDWLETRPMEIWMKGKSHYWLVGGVLQYKWIHYVLAYGGIVFDGAIIWLLLIKRTRWVGVTLSIAFHLFNSFVFQIGIFPYLMLGTLFFFFDGADLRKKLLARWKWGIALPAKTYLSKSPGYFLFFGYFLIQLLLPLRHHLFEGNVHWTDEGHKLSWHMMLRTKSGSAVYRVTNKKTGEVEKVRPSHYLGSLKGRMASTHPDIIWQFAHHLKNEYENKGWEEVAVFVDCVVSLNGHPSHPLIDPEVDLGSVGWEPFRHSEWILQWPEELQEIE